MTVESPPPVRATGRLDDRVLEALTERPVRIPFSGLRRSLGAHPEALVRALRRLEREGLVERSAAGYRSTRPAAELPGAERLLRTVARVDLPPGIEPAAVLDRLAGRWFGALRWMGIVERPDQRLLAWARRDGSGSVLLGVSRGAARIYAADGAADDGPDADDSAYELLVAVADALRRTAEPGSARGLVAHLSAGWAERPGTGPFRSGRSGPNN